MKKGISYVVALTMVSSIAVLALAQTQPAAIAPMSVNVNRTGETRLEGVIASISGNTIMVASWGGSWSVNASSAKLMRKYGGTSNLSEFQVGDGIMVIGNVTSQSSLAITARSVRDNSIQTKNANFSGTISNVSGTGFIFTTKKNGALQVTVNASTIIMVNGKTGAASDLANGMRGEIKGVWDRNQSTVIASSVRVKGISGSGDASTTKSY